MLHATCNNMNSTKNRRSPLTLLKAILILCILAVASRNFTLHNRVIEHRDRFESERRRSFVRDTRAIVDNARDDSSNGSLPPAKIKEHPINTSNNVIQYQPTKVLNLSDLPPALRPVTYQQCCPLLTRPPKKPKCGEVCLTESSCNHTYYPYTSVEQLQFMKPMDVQSKETLRLQCNEMNGRMKPPYQWCHPWLNSSGHTESSITTSYTTIDPYKAHLPPPGCSIFNNGGGSGSYQHLMLFPEAKLAFCGIPKGKKERQA